MENDQPNNLVPQNNQPPAPYGPTQEHAADVVREQINQIYQKDPPNQPKADQENPYQRSHQQNFDWSQYHSAWQQYYQEYYRQYYSQHATKTAQPQQTQTTEALKNDLRSKVRQQAKAFRQSHHFIPVISALTVGLVFLFLQFNSVFIAHVSAYISPGKLEGENIVISQPGASLTVSPEPRLIVPKINLDAPVNYGISALDDATVQKALQDGIVHYKLPAADSLPGELGNTVLLGHSSNDIFAAGKYKFALVLADQLAIDDTFFLHYNGTRYTYKVTDKKIINPDEVATLQTGYGKPMATLVTCTPPGTTFKRLLIFAEQISPDPAESLKPAETQTKDNKPSDIPGNAPTLFEKFFNLF